MSAPSPSCDLDHPITSADLRAAFAECRAEIRDGCRRIVRWIVATQVVSLAVVVTALVLLR